MMRKRVILLVIAGGVILLGGFVTTVWVIWGEHMKSLWGGGYVPVGDLPSYGRPYPIGTVIQVPASPPPAGSDPALVRILYPFGKNVVIPNPAPVTAIAESPNGDYLAWGDDAGNVFAWEVDGDKIVALNDLKLGRSIEGVDRAARVLAIRIYDDRGGLCWMDLDGVVWEAQPRGGDEWSKRALHKREISRSATFTEDGFISSTLQSGWTDEYALDKYDMLTGRRLGTCKLYPPVKGSTHYPETMALSADEKLLGVVSKCNAGVVSMDDFKLVRSFGVTGGDTIAISPDGSRAAVRTVRRELFVWDVSSGSLVHKPTHPPGSGGPLAFPSETSLWFGAADRIHRLDLASGRTETVISGVYASQMMFSRDRSRLYVGTRHGALHVYRVPSESKVSSPPRGQ